MALYCAWIGNVASNSAWFSSLVIQAYAGGKTSSTTAVQNTRVILPLPAVLQVLDALLFVLLHPFIVSLLPQQDGCWIGGLPRTQPLEITHCMSMIIEKGLDMESTGAVGTQDVRQYFDSVWLHLIYEWLVSKSVPINYCGEFLRHQLLPGVELVFGIQRVSIQGRVRGSLTGSRLAGLLARIPIEDVVSRCAHRWALFGFPTPLGTLKAATYIDNWIAPGRTPHGVVTILNEAEQELKATWDLDIKADSRAVMHTAGAADTTIADDRWPVVNSMLVLGHILQNDGGVEECFQATIHKAWKAFFTTCGNSLLAKLPIKTRLQSMQRTVTPVIEFRCSRWPFTLTLARRLDAVQRKMIAIILNVHMLSTETPESFVKCCGRLAASHQRQIGSWSRRWAKRVCDWNDHIRRDRNAACWSHMLLTVRSPDELAQRRQVHGRPQTRRFPGWCHARWTESVGSAAYHSQANIC